MVNFASPVSPYRPPLASPAIDSHNRAGEIAIGSFSRRPSPLHSRRINALDLAGIEQKNIAKNEVYLVARKKIKEIVQNSKEYGLPVEESITEEQLTTLTHRVVEFIQKTDRNGFPTLMRIEEFLDDAVWWNVRGQWVLMFPTPPLGAGGESTVYRGLLREGQECAVKCWKKEKDEKWLEKQNEFNSLMSSSSYVAKPIATDELYGLEPLYRGNLFDILYVEKSDNYCPSFVEDHIQQINEGILQGIADINENGYVYSDLKLQNVLLTDEGEVIFGDLGDCYFIGSPPNKGTYAYWAPERIKYHLEEKKERPLPFARKGDVWQAMLVLADLNEMQLSEPFRDRIAEFTARQEGLAKDLETSVKALNELNLTPWEFKKQAANMILEYAEKSEAHLNELRREGKDGIFSGLTPTTHFEVLLMQMAMFDPAKRISSAKALTHLKAYGVSAKI